MTTTITTYPIQPKLLLVLLVELSRLKEEESIWGLAKQYTWVFFNNIKNENWEGEGMK